MTLLSLCQDVADEIGLERPSAIIGNTSETAKKLLQAAQRTGKDLAKKHDWAILQKEYTFSTASGTSSYDLPSDYDHVLPYTQWDRGNYWRLIGPLSPSEWQYMKSGIVTQGPRTQYRFKPLSGTMKFYVNPTPSSVVTLAYEYVSNQWCESSTGTGKTEFTADTDVVRLDTELFNLGINWRTRKSMGLPFIVEFDQYESMLKIRKAQEGDMPRLSMDRKLDDLGLIYNIQDGNFPSS